jgi:hypothetical protein
MFSFHNPFIGPSVPSWGFTHSGDSHRNGKLGGVAEVCKVQLSARGCFRNGDFWHMLKLPPDLRTSCSPTVFLVRVRVERGIAFCDLSPVSDPIDRYTASEVWLDNTTYTTRFSYASLVMLLRSCRSKQNFGLVQTLNTFLT